MPTLTFEQARSCVLERISAPSSPRQLEEVALEDAPGGRVLAENIAADRDYPPFPRSARDGFAVRAADLPGELRIIGEVPAGSYFEGTVQAGETVEIMTGAPLPAGADAVVMVEHVDTEGSVMRCARTVSPGENYNERGSECREGEVVLPAGARISYPEIALLATVGRTRVRVFPKPRVAILATGDELVDIHARPQPWQIRNSNAHALAAQVAAAGGIPDVLPIARDNVESTKRQLETGLASDLLLLSGGVSAGKYDVVERTLSELGAEFFFERVLIQPGQPLVFGRARGTFFFGLPGNPLSTMVTFEIFARAALERLGGQTRSALPVTLARLCAPFTQRPGLTRFLPACLSDDAPEVKPLRWAGSGDVAALCRANAYLVSDPERERWEAGELIRVLVRR